MVDVWREVREDLTKRLEQCDLLKERLCELAKENARLRGLLERYQHTSCFCPADEHCICGGR